MKSFTFAAVAASLLLGVCLFVTGCSSSTSGDKMGMSDAKMSDGKMSAMESDHMADGKMSDGKMGMDNMSGKMSDGKMSGK